MLHIKAGIINGLRKAGSAAFTGSIPVFTVAEGYGVGRDKNNEYNTNKAKAKEVATNAATLGAMGAVTGTSFLGKKISKTGLSERETKALKEYEKRAKAGTLTKRNAQNYQKLNQKTKEFTSHDSNTLKRLENSAKKGTLGASGNAKLGATHAKKLAWGQELKKARIKGGIGGTLVGGALAGAGALAGGIMAKKKNNQVTASLFTKAHKEVVFTIKPKPGATIEQYDIEDTISKLGPDVRDVKNVVRNTDGSITISLVLAKDTEVGKVIKKIGNIMVGTVVALATGAAMTKVLRMHPNPKSWLR